MNEIEVTKPKLLSHQIKLSYWEKGGLNISNQSVEIQLNWLIATNRLQKKVFLCIKYMSLMCIIIMYIKTSMCNFKKTIF